MTGGSSGSGIGSARRRLLLRTIAMLVLASAVGHAVLDATRVVSRDRAVDAFSKRRYTNALRLALDELDRRPRERDASLVAARCLTALNYVDEAEIYYDIASSGRPLDREAQHDRAIGLARADRRNEAIQRYEELIHQDPDDLLAVRRLATLLWSWGRPDEAIGLAERLTSNPQDAVIGYSLLGTIQHSAMRPERSVEAHQRVLELDPELRELPLPASLFWTELGTDLIALGRNEEAAQLLTRALEQREDPVLMDLIGLAYQAEGNSELARTWWQRSIDSDPSRAPPHLYLGQLAIQSRGFHEAVKQLRIAADLNDNDYQTFNLLSMAEKLLGHDEQAHRHQQRAEKIRNGINSTSEARKVH